MNILVATAALLLISGPVRGDSASPPTFGPVMIAPFNQTITIFGYTWANTVGFWYDSTTQPVGQSVYVHSKGQHDELCTSIKGKENSDEPCTLLASNDTWRYVIFPTSTPPVCCRYCNTSEYCGIISPNWLKQNSTYQGTRQFGSQTCYGWMKEGGEQNYYWATADDVPCQYYEGYPTFGVGNNTWNFDMSQYSPGPVDGSVFDVPTGMGCDAMCETSDLTYEQRLQAAFGKQ